MECTNEAHYLTHTVCGPLPEPANIYCTVTWISADFLSVVSMKKMFIKKCRIQKSPLEKKSLYKNHYEKSPL